MLDAGVIVVIAHQVAFTVQASWKLIYSNSFSMMETKFNVGSFDLTLLKS